MQELDRIARSAGNWDHNEFNRSLRFCVRCGTENLQRCGRENNRQGKQIQGREFWCTLCGFSFNVTMSVDWALALELFKDLRSHRTMPRYQEMYVDPTVMKAWKKEFEQPTVKQTWPAKRGFSLADKLKSALAL